MKFTTATLLVLLIPAYLVVGFVGSLAGAMYVGFLPLPTQYIYQTQEVEVTKLVVVTATPEPVMSVEPSQNANELHTNPYPYPYPSPEYLPLIEAPYPTPAFGLITPEPPSFQQDLATAYPIIMPTLVTTPTLISTVQGYYAGEAHNLRVQQGQACFGRA